MNAVMGVFMMDWKNVMTLSADSELDANSLECYVLSDQLRLHMNQDLRRDVHDDPFEMWPLPRNTSHFSQPLDNIPFQVVRNQFSTLSEELMESCAASGVEWKRYLLSIMLDVVVCGFTPAVLQAAFANTRLWPWSMEGYVSYVRECLGLQPRPVEGSTKEWWKDFADALSMLEQREADAQKERDRSLVVICRKRVRKYVAVDPRDLAREPISMAGELVDASPIESAEPGSNRKRRKMPDALAKLSANERLCRGGCAKSCQGGVSRWRKCVCGRYYVCLSCLARPEVAESYELHRQTCLK
jgi:hypothetical protein